MPERRVIPISELELMSPDERARLVRENMLDSLDQLDPAFRARVEAKHARLLQELDAPPPAPG
ncbi:MAG: hypothetical protein AAGC53_08985 [Actinomycetota bacterium]